MQIEHRVRNRNGMMWSNWSIVKDSVLSEILKLVEIYEFVSFCDKEFEYQYRKIITPFKVRNILQGKMTNWKDSHFVPFPLDQVLVDNVTSVVINYNDKPSIEYALNV